MLSSEPSGIYDPALWFFSRSYKAQSAAHTPNSQRRKTYRERIDVGLARHDIHAVKPLNEVQLLPDGRRVALDVDGEEAAREATSESEHADALAPELRGLDAREERREAAVQGRGVHVAATPCAAHAELDGALELLLGDADEGLLECLVRKRLLVRLRKDRFRVRDVCVLRRFGVRHEVVPDLRYNESHDLCHP